MDLSVTFGIVSLSSQCCYAECHLLSNVKLSVTLLGAVAMSNVKLSVIILGAVAMSVVIFGVFIPSVVIQIVVKLIVVY
jgi:hypothetical protein